MNTLELSNAFTLIEACMQYADSYRGLQIICTAAWIHKKPNVGERPHGTCVQMRTARRARG